MIKKVLFILFLSFLLIIFLFNFNNNENSKTESVSLNSSEVSVETDHEVYFDCEAVFDSEKNKINIRIIDDYNVIPSISGNGNIGFNIIMSDYCLNELELLLPQIDGELELLLSFGDEIVRRTVYSSYRNGVYGISTLSLYSAKQIVGNLHNQEYMDNDINEGIYVPTPDDVSYKDFQYGNRGSGNVSGTLRWEDDNNQLHYLIGVKVKLSNSYYYTYTNSNGYFEIPLYGYSGYCSLHIYAKNEKIEVKDNNLDIYEKVQNFYVIDYAGYVFNYDFTKYIDSDLAGSMQIFMAASSFANFADSVVNSTLNGSVPSCNIIYPSNTSECAYCDGINTIELCSESYRVTGSPSVAGSWDTIGHEYGHHLQYHNFRQDYSGIHTVNKNCLYKSIMTNNINSLYDSRIPLIKDGSVGLAFNEAWPTFFSIVAQKSFNVGLVPTVGDNLYQSYNDVEQNLSYSSANDLNFMQGGESDELVIMRILFRLWDTSQHSWDTISFDFGTIWNIMYYNEPANLSEFISAFYTNQSYVAYIDGINKILENYEVSPSNLQIDQITNYYVQPTFTWDENNEDVYYNNLTFRFSNTKFLLEFYNPNGSLLFATDYIYDNIYTLTESQWNQICASNISNYNVRIKAYAPYGTETGPYYSSLYTFSKPTINPNYAYNINISDSKYYEKQFTITAGTSWQFNITFDHSGNKLFQTFGNQDTKMQLFDVNGTPLTFESDDDGYSLNSLLFENLQSNTNYKLVVSLYNSSVTATTKLAIINYGGNYQNNTIYEFEDIYYISSQNYIYNTSVSQYNATVIVWQPTVTGIYTVELDSVFNNFLYIIDPESSNYLIDGDDYIDDFAIDEDQGLYDINAKLYGYFYNNKKYVIIANQSEPFNNGGSVSIEFYFLM